MSTMSLGWGVHQQVRDGLSWILNRFKSTFVPAWVTGVRDTPDNNLGKKIPFVETWLHCQHWWDTRVNQHEGSDNELYLSVFFRWIEQSETQKNPIREGTPKLSTKLTEPSCNFHTFSAFWLRSSVVSVLISLISDMGVTDPLQD